MTPPSPKPQTGGSKESGWAWVSAATICAVANWYALNKIKDEGKK